MAARLSFDERCVISAMVGVGASAGQIADELGRHSSTVRREINRAGGRGVYRAEDAQTEAEVRARRPKVPKLVTDPQLAEAVTQRLGMGWSPHAVAADLRNEGSLSLVCAETIYQACYEPCGARGLTAGSWRWLPRRRRRRKPRSRCEQAKRSPLGDIRPISDRPPAAADRSEPGHSVRRFDHRRPQPHGGGNTHRTGHPPHPPSRSAQRLPRSPHRPGHLRRLLPRSQTSAENAHLGPRKRNEPMVLCRTANRSLDLFLRPPITLAKTHQRAHQRHAPPLAAQKHQPQHRPNTPLHHRRQPQPHATTTTQLAQPPRPLQSTNEQPPLELAKPRWTTSIMSYPSHGVGWLI